MTFLVGSALVIGIIAAGIALAILALARRLDRAHQEDMKGDL